MYCHLHTQSPCIPTLTHVSILTPTHSPAASYTLTLTQSPSIPTLTLAQLVLRSPEGDGLGGGLRGWHFHGHACLMQDLLDVGTAWTNDVLVLGLAHLH